MPPRPDSTVRARLFALVAGAFLAVGTGVVAIAAVSGGVAQRPADDLATIRASRAAPHVFVRRNGHGDDASRIAIVPATGSSAPAALTALSCQRFYYAADRGVCLTVEPGFFASYRALVLDAGLNVTATLPLAGIPSRARVSSDGRYAAATVFVSGHSYAGTGFSTQTLIIDLDSGTPVGDLEEFAVQHDGITLTAPDMNFWGVTFTADSNVFYATIGTGNQRYLVRGNIAERRIEILEPNVECPSISPDGTRIAFKRRVRTEDAVALTGRPYKWQLSVLSLSDLSVTPLAETRDLDDQAEWLDDDTLLYGVVNPDTQLIDVWAAPSDGSGQPSLFAAGSESPSAAGPASLQASPPQ